MLHRNLTRIAVVGALGLLAACARETTAPPEVSVEPRLLSGPATTTNLTVRPAMVGGAANNLLGVALDAAPGFGGGSIAANASIAGAKSDMSPFTPEALFGGREVALGEVSSISYWTKTGATHTVDVRDWFLTIYTKPYAGDLSTPAWYGDRIGTEPYFSANLNDPANTWNQWSTGGATNKLRFFESTQGAPGATFGTYTDPDWATLLSGNALSGLPYSTRKILYFSVQTGSAWANGFTGRVDGLRIELIDGSVATINFEPDLPACTTTCYADAVNGNDANSGSTAADAKKTIQAAINQVSSNGTVRVLPGTYNEAAPNSAPTSLGGIYQFGLFFGSAKPGITLMGVTAADAPITSAAATLATINTNATNNFGTSGIFVEAANTKIQGVKIGPNAAGDNKTIEVVADNFTLQYSATAIPTGGAIYISEFDPPATAVSSYHILDNLFADATQIAISSGAGQGGPVTSREIKGNTFTMGGNTWPAVSFNGSGGVPWYTKTVGGAIISGNSFSGGGLQYIRARGTYIEAQFDWQAWWNNNTYDKATVDLVTEAPFVVRAFSYTSAPYTFTNVRRIGATIQGEVDDAGTNDVVLAKSGSYPEQVVVSKDNLTIKGAGVSTIVQGAACTGTGIALIGDRSNIAIKLLSITGFQYGITTGNIGNTVSNILIEDASASANCVHGLWFQAGTTNNVTVRRVTASNNGPGQNGRGLWMINGVKSGISIIDGTFNNNGLVGIDISDGNVTGLTITGNTVVGNFDSGIGVLGAKGPDANLIANNTVTNNGRFGIEVKVPTGSGAASGAGSVVVKDNIVSRNIAATDARDYAGIAVFRRSGNPAYNDPQPSGVVVSGNTVSGFTRKPSGSTGDGFGIVVEGTGHLVTKNSVSGSDVGIQIQSGNVANTQSTDYFDRGDAAPSSALINRNSITGNTLKDIRNVGAGLTDATCNWFGSATGPVSAKLSGSLTTNPWLTTSNLDGGCGPDDQGPITTLTTPAPAPINTAIVVPVSISDLTTGNSPLLSYTWSRDGGAPTTVNFATSAVTQNFNLNISADAVADVDNICVKATDVYGNVGPEVCTLVVWYNPNGGFVTGGGWITSPAGAYVASPLITGKANFGFVSKYEKGKTLPSGNTEFQFNAANLNFKATAMEWLVVSGAKAQYKGSGTINGTGDYRFMLTVIDGQESGGGGSDKFRIRIWNNVGGGLVYDNQMNAPDTSDPTTVIGGGSIVIHK